VKNLFGADDPIGRTISIKGKPFSVVGTLEPKGQSLDGRDQDDTIVIPLATAQGKVFGNPFPGTVRLMLAQARSAEELQAAEDEITQLLRERHRLSGETENDFTVRNLTSYAQTAAMAARTLTLMLGAVGSIALLVGGIGIMNIMLVSVTERTREIGLRMAVGARQGQILTQFLVEAIVICVIGGVLGVLLGGTVAWFLSRGLAMEVELTSSAALVAFAFAAGSGLLFGLFPAQRAARLNPVDALRYE
jgi:putative ABC transport system permease protein